MTCSSREIGYNEMEHKTERRVGVQFDFGEFKIWLDYGLLGLIILEFLRDRLAKLQKMITLQLNTAGGYIH